MSKIKIRDHEFAIPNILRVVHNHPYESLLLLGAPIDKTKYTIVLGVGVVRRIEKGEDFDLVGMDFGAGFTREIYVKSNHARRQIYTLKRGQYAWFYGTLKYYTENGKRKSSLFAKAFPGWYVPKNLDIKKLDPEEIEKLTQENESKINFIDELLQGDK